MRVDVFLWPLMGANVNGVSSQTRMTITTKDGVLLLSDETSACKSAINMSSCSYSEWAMQELVHRNYKKCMPAPKTASSGKVEQ
jgi:hypothetical protein